MPDDDFMELWDRLATRISAPAQPPGAVATIAFMGYIAALIARSSGLASEDESRIESSVAELMDVAHDDLVAYFDQNVHESSIARTPDAVLQVISGLRLMLKTASAVNEVDRTVAVRIMTALEGALREVIAHNCSSIGEFEESEYCGDRRVSARLPGLYNGQEPLASIRSARGVWLFDENDARWFDASSGMWNVPLGHAAPAPLRGLIEQATTVAAVDAFQVSTGIADAVATLLADVCGVPEASVWFVSSGSEAIESALRLGLAASTEGSIWSLPNEFHGSTAGAASLSNFDPVWAPFRDSQRLSHVAEAWEWRAPGVGFFEPVSGVGGCVEVDSNTVQALKRFQESGGIVVADEVACGLGRAAWPTVSARLDLEPDIILLGKGLGNGVSPIACVIARPAVVERAAANGGFDDGHTHSNHPASLGAALQTLRALRDLDFEGQAAVFEEGLIDAGVLTTGGGFFRAVHGPAVEPDRLREALIACKLMIHIPTSLTKCEKLILAPPFVITHEESVILGQRVRAVKEMIGWT